MYSLKTLLYKKVSVNSEVCLGEEYTTDVFSGETQPQNTIKANDIITAIKIFFI